MYRLNWNPNKSHVQQYGFRSCSIHVMDFLEFPREARDMSSCYASMLHSCFFLNINSRRNGLPLVVKYLANDTKIYRLLTKFRHTGRVYSRQQVWHRRISSGGTRSKVEDTPGPSPWKLLRRRRQTSKLSLNIPCSLNSFKMAHFV
jgi:hypothetical protein